MRRAVVTAALAATLVGCSPDIPVVEQQPVRYDVTLELYQQGGVGLFEMDVTWGHSADPSQKEHLVVPAWKKELTVSWPDESSVYVTGVAQPKPGVDHGMAYLNGTPKVRCVLKLNGQVVRDITDVVPQCDYNLNGSPPPAPSGSQG
ncbi:hypothetical protein [Micromonospora sp. NPDC092111]|uniref:hypothetical protein n=1 Tax=Micromonospora sp. NPDC092111 TaxID=3364289 RepID=UPI0037FA0E0C